MDVRYWLGRFHLWGGLFLTLPMLIVGTTGVFLAFKPEVKTFFSDPSQGIRATGDRVALSAIIARLEERYDSLEVFYFGAPRRRGHPYTIFGKGITNGKTHDLGGRQFNPYTGAVLGRTRGKRVVELLTRIHRNMMLGQIGRYVIAASTILFVLTILSGLYLWWPMWRGTFVRLWRNNDSLGWHNIVGLVGFLPLIVVALTGVSITFSPTVRSSVYWLAGDRKPRPPEFDPGGKSNPWSNTLESVQKKLQGRIIRSFSSAGENGQIAEIQLTTPEGLTGQGWDLVYVDRTTNRILKRINLYDRSWGSVYNNSYFWLHTGIVFPLKLRAVWGILALSVPVLTVTGLLIWVSKGMSLT